MDGWEGQRFLDVFSAPILFMLRVNSLLIVPWRTPRHALKLLHYEQCQWNRRQKTSHYTTILQEEIFLCSSNRVCKLDMHSTFSGNRMRSVMEQISNEMTYFHQWHWHVSVWLHCAGLGISRGFPEDENCCACQTPRPACEKSDRPVQYSRWLFISEWRVHDNGCNLLSKCWLS